MLLKHSVRTWEAGVAGTATTRRRTNPTSRSRPPKKAPRRSPPPKKAPKSPARTVKPPPREPLHPGLRRDLIGVGLVVVALLTVGALLATGGAGLLGYWR